MRSDDRTDRTAGNWRSGGGSELPVRETPREPRNGLNVYQPPMERNMRQQRGFEVSQDRFEVSGNRSRGFDSFDDYNDRQRSDRNFNRGFDRGFSDRSRLQDRGFGGERGFERNDRPFERQERETNLSRDTDRNFSEMRLSNDRRTDRDSFPDRETRQDSESVLEERRKETPSNLATSENPPERRKLVLQPRSKPLTSSNEPVSNSAIFGGAKPVNTAAREREIEERLLKEREEVDRKESSTGERVRRISAGSNVSGSRSRKGSDPYREDSDSRPEDDSFRNRSNIRQRKTSERSSVSDRSVQDAPKHILRRKEGPSTPSQTPRYQGPYAKGRNNNGNTRSSQSGNNPRKRNEKNEREKLVSRPIASKSDNHEDKDSVSDENVFLQWYIRKILSFF